MSETVGSRIKAARLKRGLTQEQLATAIGITQQGIQRIETGKTKRTWFLAEIAEALNVNWQWLARGVGPMSGPSRPRNGNSRHPVLSPA